MLMTLELSVVPPSSASGIYGGSKDQLPDRMRFLHPEAAASLAVMATSRKVRCSDMLRTAESSLQAHAEKRGVQPPAYSAHNFGLAIDLDVDYMLTQYDLNKTDLDTWMDENGWVCHRTDHATKAMECWHFNFLGLPGTPDGDMYRALVKKDSSGAIEKKIQNLYGVCFAMNDAEVQASLLKLHFYSGECDGKIGPLTRQAIHAFQRAWKLDDTGMLDIKVERTLAFVSADRHIT